MINFISQSMYKDYVDYQNGSLCGIVFYHKWITQDYPQESTDVQDAGWWFEDMVVRGKSEKEPKRIKSGSFNALYRQLDAHIPKAKEMLLDEGKIISADKTEYRNNVRVKRDVVVRTNEGKIKVIDIKTTGHLNNKWDFYGWGALIEGDVYSDRFQKQRSHKMIQAQTYMSVPVGAEMPDEFEYWVFSSKDDGVQIISFSVEDVEGWYEHLEDTFQQIHDSSFFAPYPTFKSCSECPLKQDCVYKTTKPDKISV